MPKTLPEDASTPSTSSSSNLSSMKKGKAHKLERLPDAPSRQFEKAQRRLLQSKLKKSIAKTLMQKELNTLYSKQETKQKEAPAQVEDEISGRHRRAASLVANRALTAVYDMDDELFKKLETSLVSALVRLSQTVNMAKLRLDCNFLLEECMKQLQVSGTAHWIQFAFPCL